MRRVAVLAVLAALAMPVAAWAGGIDLTNQYGTVTILASGITTRGSELLSFNGIEAPKGQSLGNVNFGTGALTSGDIYAGGVFSDVGSYFNIIGRGMYGQPRGAIFTGAFVSPIDWTIVATGGKGNKNFTEYELSGEIGGTVWTGRYVYGTTAQFIDTYHNQEVVDHKGNIGLGQTHLNTPEPTTLGLLGIGLVAIAGAFRRK